MCTYGLELLLSGIEGAIIIAVITLILGEIGFGICFLLILIPTRCFMGGYHASTHFRCSICIALIYTATIITFYGMRDYNLYGEIEVAVIISFMIVGKLAPAAATVLLAMPVMAESQGFAFLVDLADGTEEQYSEGNPKDDWEQASYVHCQSGNINDSDDFYMQVHNSGYAAVSDMQRVDNSQGDYYMPFTCGSGDAGEYMHLRGVTYRYFVSISGYWFS